MPGAPVPGNCRPGSQGVAALRGRPSRHRLAGTDAGGSAGGSAAAGAKRVAPTAISPVSTATTTNDTDSEEAPAIPPITAGAANPAPYEMVATPAIACPGWLVAEPAAVKVSGTTTDTPTPSSANPRMPGAAWRDTATSTAPAAARMPPIRTVPTTPIRLTTPSPTSRPAAIANANPVYAPAATPCGAWATSVRYLAAQSEPAPSPNTAQNPSSPSSSTGRGGSANAGGSTASGRGRTGGSSRAANWPSTSSTAASTAKCSRPSTFRAAASTPTPEAASPPTLHSPCSPDMIDRPTACSTATASAFIATSAIPEAAP
ncbi:hypothetical protein Athai_27270 [Actinocatenispora thailandica]|uniref:Uncharacterized protein n=1 Tax=Actinocatenispora thailandica TaxID=227318 RepID=A0A7R7HXM1_9ACTN|nr:hypothetical protein Athai_27270 [Actinocatenispora thailandica]